MKLLSPSPVSPTDDKVKSILSYRKDKYLKAKNNDSTHDSTHKSPLMPRALKSTTVSSPTEVSPLI